MVSWDYFNRFGEKVCTKHLNDKKEYRIAWHVGNKQENQCLYNEQELYLKNDDIVYIAEGEKDADTLKRAGFLAVTNLAGAKHWPDNSYDLFRNRCVVICEDNDEAGKTRTKMLVKKLSPYVSEIRLISFEGQREKYDVTNWFEGIWLNFS